MSNRQVSIIEYDNGEVEIELNPQMVKYEFASWDEAIESIPAILEDNKG